MGAIQPPLTPAPPGEAQLGLAVISSLPAGLAILSPDRKVLFWNTRAAELFGLPSGDVLARPASELYHAMAGRTDVPQDRERAILQADQRAETRPQLQVNL